ncbi:MAG: hypothetical protein AB7R40_23715 [Nitrospiraceae bacterium]
MNILDERDELILSYWERMPTVDEARKHLANHMGVPALKPLKKPCHDCAITCGFYTPVAATLSLLTDDEIDERSLQWFCHNHPNRACAGNIAYQARIRAASERDMEAGR